MTQLVEHFEAAIAALEAQDLDGARAACDAAVRDGSKRDHVALRFISFMTSWLDASADDEQLDQIEDMIDEGLALSEVDLATRIVVDLADIMLAAEEPDEAEHALRRLFERDDLDERDIFDVQLMRVEIALDEQQDPEEALELLADVPQALQSEPGYVSLHVGALMDLDRRDEAVELLREAVAQTDDTELRYQLGMILQGAGEAAASADQLLTVRARDLAELEIDLAERIPPDQAEGLKRLLEDVLDTLPDPVMRELASAAIRVEHWPSEAAVKAGADPRSGIYFEGQPASDDEEAKLDAIVIHRDVLLAQIEDDDELVELMALGLVVECDRMLDVEIIPGV